MEYWEKEEIKELEKEFLQALKEKKPDFDKAKCLIDRGVDINAKKPLIPYRTKGFSDENKKTRNR